MPEELSRFLTLFDALVVAGNAWIERTPSEKLEWVPVDNPNMKFGDRISTINIKSVYIHTILGERHWAALLGDCADGAVLKPAPDPENTRRLTESDDVVRDAMAIHRDNMERFAALSPAQLAKRIKWSGSDWTVMGFLWGIYCHRAYHLGNIDIYLREADEPAPDFFSNFQQAMA